MCASISPCEHLLPHMYIYFPQSVLFHLTQKSLNLNIRHIHHSTYWDIYTTLPTGIYTPDINTQKTAKQWQGTLQLTCQDCFVCLELPASHRKRNVWEPLRLEQNPQVIWEPAVRNLEVDSVALARDVDAVCHHWDLRTLDLQGGCTEEVIVMTCFTYSKKERYIGKLNFFWMVQDEKKGEMILDTLQQSKIWGENKTKQNSKTSNKTTKRTQLLGIVPWPLKTSKKKKACTWTKNSKGKQINPASRIKPKRIYLQE